MKMMTERKLQRQELPRNQTESLGITTSIKSWEDMIDKGEKTPQDIIKTLESAFRVSKETKANIMQL